MLGAVERFEGHALLLVAHALAGVAQAQDQAVAVVPHRLDAQRTALGHGFQAIGDQAVENLPEQYRLAEHLHRRHGVDLHLDPLAQQLWFECLQAVLQDAQQLHRFGCITEGTQ
ncbi:hypothetical protein D9M71_794020 [compost metagenome]